MGMIDVDSFIVSLHNKMFDNSIEKERLERILSEQGLKVVDGERLEKTDDVEDGLSIVEGEWYVCIRDWPNREGIAHKGGIYQCVEDDFMIGDDGKKYAWYSRDVNAKYFRKATPDDLNNIHRFQIHDWVVCPFGNRIGQIVGTWCDCYVIRFNHDAFDTYEYMSMVDKKWHHWTLSDAKNGDILVDLFGNVGIFKNRTNVSWESYLYLASKMDAIFYYGGSHTCFTVDNVRPATSEEMRRLWTVMDNDGKVWDANNNVCVEKTTTVNKDELSSFEKAFDSIAYQYITNPDMSIEYVKRKAEEMLEAAMKEIERKQAKDNDSDIHYNIVD